MDTGQTILTPAVDFLQIVVATKSMEKLMDSRFCLDTKPKMQTAAKFSCIQYGVLLFILQVYSQMRQQM